MDDLIKRMMLFIGEFRNRRTMQSEFPNGALSNHDFSSRLSSVGALFFDSLDDAFAVANLAEDDVSAVQPAGIDYVSFNLPVVIKNCEPLVSGPALAIEMQKGSCLSLKFSSLKLLPKTERPPVPSWFVKSPPESITKVPWIMKLGIILWKEDPSYLCSIPSAV